MKMSTNSSSSSTAAQMIPVTTTWESPARQHQNKYTVDTRHGIICVFRSSSSSSGSSAAEGLTCQTSSLTTMLSGSWWWWSWNKQKSIQKWTSSHQRIETWQIKMFHNNFLIQSKSLKPNSDFGFLSTILLFFSLFPKMGSLINPLLAQTFKCLKFRHFWLLTDQST